MTKYAMKQTRNTIYIIVGNCHYIFVVNLVPRTLNPQNIAHSVNPEAASVTYAGTFGKIYVFPEL